MRHALAALCLAALLPIVLCAEASSAHEAGAPSSLKNMRGRDNVLHPNRHRKPEDLHSASKNHPAGTAHKSTSAQGVVEISGSTDTPALAPASERVASLDPERSSFAWAAVSLVLALGAAAASFCTALRRMRDDPGNPRTALKKLRNSSSSRSFSLLFGVLVLALVALPVQVQAQFFSSSSSSSSSFALPAGSSSSSSSSSLAGAPDCGNDCTGRQYVWMPCTATTSSLCRDAPLKCNLADVWTTDNTVTTFAGSTTRSSGYDDGVGTNARFNWPFGVDYHPSGLTAYIADRGSNSIRAIDISSAEVTTLAGGRSTKRDSGFVDAAGTNALFRDPSDVAVTVDGSTLVVADFENCAIRAVDLTTPFNNVTTLVGSSSIGCETMFEPVDGDASTVRLFQPFSIVAHPDGRTFYFIDTDFQYDDSRRSWVRKLVVDGSMMPVVTTLAYVGNKAHGIALHPDLSYLLVTRVSGGEVVKVSLLTHGVTVVAGGGSSVFNESANGLDAYFEFPFGVAITPDGSTALVSNWGDTEMESYAQIRAIDLETTAVTTVAGKYYGMTDGSGSQAQFAQPRLMKISPDGQTLLVVDNSQRNVRAIELCSIKCNAVCGGGTWMDTPASCSQDVFPGCQYCPEDFQVAPPGSTSPDACDCAPGYWRPDGMSQCQECRPMCGSNEYEFQACTSRTDRDCRTGLTCPSGLMDVWGAPDAVSSISTDELEPSPHCTMCKGCGTQYAARSFTDGSAPGASYFDNSDCTWILAPEGATQVQITFDRYHVESCCDYVTLYECSDAACSVENLMIELSSNDREAEGNTYTSTTGYMKVHFYTDGSATEPGFEAHWTHDGQETYDASTDLSGPAAAAYTLNGTVLVALSGEIVQYTPVYDIWRSDTLAGSPAQGYADGPASTAMFSQPAGLAMTSDGSAVLIADSNNHRIRRLDLLELGTNFSVTTVAGSGNMLSTDGTGISADFNTPFGIATSPDGRVALVTEAGGHRVRKIMLSTGEVTTLAGSGIAGFANGNGASASFNTPTSIAITPTGALALVADMSNDCIRGVDTLSGMVTTVAGSCGSPGSADGIGGAASFSRPFGITMMPDGGSALITDHNNNRVRALHLASSEVTTIAGYSVHGSVEKWGARSQFDSPRGIAVSPFGGMEAAVVDWGAKGLRRIDLCPVKCRAECDGLLGFSQDAPAMCEPVDTYPGCTTGDTSKPWCSGQCQCDTFTEATGVLTDGSPFSSGPKSRWEWLSEVYDAGSTCNWIIAPAPKDGEMDDGPLSVRFPEFWLDESDFVSVYSCRTVEGCNMGNTTNAVMLGTFYGSVRNVSRVTSQTGIILVHFESRMDSPRYPGFKAVWQTGEGPSACFDSDQCGQYEICDGGMCVNNECGVGLSCDECRPGHNPCKPHEVCVDPDHTVVGDAECLCHPVCEGECDDDNFCHMEEESVCDGPMGNPCTDPMYPVCYEYWVPDPSTMTRRAGSALNVAGGGGGVRRGGKGGKSLKHGLRQRRDYYDMDVLQFECLARDRCEANPTACPAGYLCQDPCTVNASYWEMVLGSLVSCPDEVAVMCGGVDECVKYDGICGDRECLDTNFSVETGDPGKLCYYDECDNTMNLCHDLEKNWQLSVGFVSIDEIPYKLNRPETVGMCEDYDPFHITGGHDMYWDGIECAPNACYDFRGNPKCGMLPCRQRRVVPFEGYDPHNYQCKQDECIEFGCPHGWSCRDPDMWVLGDMQCGTNECDEMPCGNATTCHDPNFMVVGDFVCNVAVNECEEDPTLCMPNEMCVEGSELVPNDYSCECMCDHGCKENGRGCMMLDECKDEAARRMACPDATAHCRDDDMTKLGGVQCGVDECAMADKFCYNCDGDKCFMRYDSEYDAKWGMMTWQGDEGAVSCRDPDFSIVGDVQCGATKADMCTRVPYNPLGSGDDRTVGEICEDYLDGMAERYLEMGFPMDHPGVGCYDDDLIGHAGEYSEKETGRREGGLPFFLHWSTFRQVCGFDECRLNPGICGDRRCKDVDRLQMDGPEVICEKDDCREGNVCLPEEECVDTNTFKHAESEQKSRYASRNSMVAFLASDMEGHKIQLTQKIYDDGVQCAVDECLTSCRPTEDCRDPNHFVKGDVMCGFDECTRNPCGPRETCMDYNFVRFGDYVCQYDECQHAADTLCEWYETCRDTDLENLGGVQCGVDECQYDQRHQRFGYRYWFDGDWAPLASDDDWYHFRSCFPQDKCFDPDLSVYAEGLCNVEVNGQMVKAGCPDSTQAPAQSGAEHLETPFWVYRGRASRCIPPKMKVSGMSYSVHQHASYPLEDGHYYYPHCTDYKSCSEGWVDECVSDPCNDPYHPFYDELRSHTLTSGGGAGDLYPTGHNLFGSLEEGSGSGSAPLHPTWSGPFSSLSLSGSGSGSGNVSANDTNTNTNTTRRFGSKGRRAALGAAHQDADMFTQWACRDRDWTKMARSALDICGIDECRLRPYPCGGTENCVDGDLTRSGTAQCWADECRLSNPCRQDQKCFDPDIFELGSAVECREREERPWGKVSRYAGCALDSWEVITQQLVEGTVKFHTGSLNVLTTPEVKAWVCVEGHECASVAGANASHFCFVYHEVEERFVPWGSEDETGLLDKSSCGGNHTADAV